MSSQPHDALCVNGYVRVTLYPETALSVSPQVTRRMTSLQKAVLETYAQVREIAPAYFQELAESRVPIFYASPFGELAASAALHTSIFSGSYPVSPTSFQHSVDNAAPAYIAIVYQAPHPCLSFSTGYLSFDKALFWAATQIRHGRYHAALLIHGADSVTTTPGAQAEAEILVLGKTSIPGLKPRFWLRDVQYQAATSPRKNLEKAIHESPGAMAPALDLMAKTSSFTRAMMARDGSSIISTWEYGL